MNMELLQFYYRGDVSPWRGTGLNTGRDHLMVRNSNKILAVVKIVGLTGLVIVVGVLLYWLGKRNAVQAAAL
jgi:hypothetical protein